MPPGAETADETDEELPTSLEDAADLLYGMGREEFIGVRDALVKQVRAAGDRELATEIGGLRKPSVAAWVANRLAREYPDEVEGLEELGGFAARRPGEARGRRVAPAPASATG